MCTREKLAEIAKREALRPLRGVLSNKESNIQPIVDLFPKWNIEHIRAYIRIPNHYIYY